MSLPTRPIHATALCRALLLFAVAGCGGAPTTSSGRPSAQVASAAPRAPKQVEADAPCTPDARPEKVGPGHEKRRTGVTALGAGKLSEAVDALTQALEADPTDLSSFALREAASTDLSEQRRRSGGSFAQLKPVVLEALAPPQKSTRAVDAAPAPKLAIVSEQAQPDFNAWVASIGVESPIESVTTGEGGEVFAPSIGELDLSANFHGSDLDGARYGQSLLVFGSDARGLRAVNLELALQTAFKDKLTKLPGVAPESILPEVRFATVVGSTLIAQFAHEASPPAKADAVVAGFDLEHDKPLFVTDSEVGNSYSGYATGTHYVTAFTDENGGSIQVVELASGKVVATVPVKQRIDYVLGKGGDVYAWSALTTLSLSLSPAPARAEPNLGATRRSNLPKATALSEATRCRLTNAVVALDHRDGEALSAISDELLRGPSATQVASTAKALRGAADFLRMRADGTPGVDLTEKKPTPMVFVDGPLVLKDKSRAVSKRLVPVKDATLNAPLPPNAMEDGLVDRKRPWARLPQPTPLYSSVRLDFYPQAYGSWSAVSAFRYEDDVVLDYGSRFLAIVRKNQVESILDSKPLLGPEAGSTSAANVAPISFLTMLDGTLYVLISSVSSYGQLGAGYVAALDRRSGKILWRTRAGMLTRPFIVFDDVLVTVDTGAGRKGDAATKGSGAVVLLRLSTGQELQTVPLKETPIDFGWDSRGAIFVTGAKGRELFSLK